MFHLPHLFADAHPCVINEVPPNNKIITKTNKKLKLSLVARVEMSNLSLCMLQVMHL